MSDEQLLHRDDLPMGVAERVVKELQERYPGAQVRFAGDEPGGASEATAGRVAALEERFMESLVELRCVDCGEMMPNASGFESDGWQPEHGWRLFKDHRGHPKAWQCPKCDRPENRELYVVMSLDIARQQLRFVTILEDKRKARKKARIARLPNCRAFNLFDSDLGPQLNWWLKGAGVEDEAERAEMIREIGRELGRMFREKNDTE